MVSPALVHVDMGDKVTWQQQWQLVDFMAQVLDATEKLLGAAFIGDRWEHKIKLRPPMDTSLTHTSPKAAARRAAPLFWSRKSLASTATSALLPMTMPAQGFQVVAPALFDRVQRDLELGYNPTDTAQGMKAARQIGMDAALQDVAASISHARAQWRGLKIGVLGFCYGGSLAWLAATRLDPAAAVCYYGGQIAANAAETPRCPVMMHFGAKDPHIGPAGNRKDPGSSHPALAAVSL